MKKVISILLFISMMFLLLSCNGTSGNKSEEIKGSIDYGEFDDLDYLSSSMKLYFEDEEIPVYNCKTNFSHTWNADAPQRMNNGVAILSLDGKVTLKLTVNFDLHNKCTIRPLDKKITPVFDKTGNSVSFTISEVGQYTIEMSNDRTLHLFVTECGAYDEYKELDNVIYFGPGVHNKNNSEYIGKDNLIKPNSNTVIYIDAGAIVEAGIYAYGKDNITVVGEGIISGACFDRSASKNTRLIPYEFDFCKNIKFLGVSTLDPAGWCYNLFFCNNVLLDNIKIISSRSNGDGVSVQSCQNVECKNSFVRSWDDSLVVKNYPRWDNKDVEGITRNIKFSNCILWTDLAQSMETGYETVGEIMENIVFEDITVLHNYHKAPISIHNANNANVKNVVFRNITIEDARMGKGDGRNVLIEITTEFSSTWSNGHKKTSLGSVDGVLIENVNVYNANNPLVTIRGSIDARSEYSDEIHYVSNVTIKNVIINGVKLSDDYGNLELIYCKDISIK